MPAVYRSLRRHEYPLVRRLYSYSYRLLPTIHPEPPLFNRKAASFGLQERMSPAFSSKEAKNVFAFSFQTGNRIWLPVRCARNDYGQGSADFRNFFHHHICQSITAPSPNLLWKGTPMNPSSCILPTIFGKRCSSSVCSAQGSTSLTAKSRKSYLAIRCS